MNPLVEKALAEAVFNDRSRGVPRFSRWIDSHDLWHPLFNEKFADCVVTCLPQLKMIRSQVESLGRAIADHYHAYHDVFMVDLLNGLVAAGLDKPSPGWFKDAARIAELNLSDEKESFGLSSYWDPEDAAAEIQFNLTGSHSSPEAAERVALKAKWKEQLKKLNAAYDRRDLEGAKRELDIFLRLAKEAPKGRPIIP